jgi:competence protein ComEA
MLKVLICGLLMTLAAWASANESNRSIAAEVPAVVNINTANAETLALVLDGVGASKAHAIVAYRDEHGTFASANELTEVKGIGNRIVDANAGKILIND